MSLSPVLEAVRRKNEHLYVVNLGELEVPFRLLPIKKAQQYAYMLATISDEALRVLIFEFLYNEVVEDAWLKESSDIPAGIPETISNLVLFMSGIGNNEENDAYIHMLIQSERAGRLKIITFMERTICATFSGYTFEMLENLSFPELIKVFIQAESALLEVGRIAEEYDIMGEREGKSTQKTLQQQIKEDMSAYKEFNAEEQRDEKRIEADTRMQKMRQQAMERAEREEQQYRSKLRNR